jgi:aspartyl-tRNA(Asn)/glutamyl-tRNA(Gln) amidotransferase subunit A
MMEGLPGTAGFLRAAFLEGATTATAICEDVLARIAASNRELGAMLAVDEAAVLRRAAALDRLADRRLAGPLAAVPVAVKDNICTAGLTTTAGSRALADFVPPYNATAVERLEQAGAIIVGKANCDEFAMGSSSEHSAFGPVRNPWDRSRTPGGSSGGSAAAVAAGLVPVALGSDTGGSVRQPAALCGCVGLRPTYGRVSRHGLIAFASSMDQIGPLAITVRDAAAVLRAVAGPDALDATTVPEPVPDWEAALDGDVRGCRIGFPKHLLDRGVDPEVASAVESALAVLAARGAEVRDIALAHADLAVPVYYLLATAEASSNLARYDGVRYGHRAAGTGGLRTMYERSRSEGFGAEVTRRIILGTFVLSAGYYDAYYVKAQAARAQITAGYISALAEVDLVALPTSPTAAFPLGERLQDPVAMYLSDVFTVGASLAGLPALSVPCGFTGGGLPVGLQFIGRPFDEAALVRAADAYERETGFWRLPASGTRRSGGA